MYELEAMPIETVRITSDIKLPIPAGENQYGGAWFADEKEINSLLEDNVLFLKDENVQDLCNRGHIDFCNGYNPYKDNIVEYTPFLHSGLVVSQEQTSEKYTARVFAGDCNNLIFGATRSGKTRYLTIPSICNNLLAGANSVVTDIKGELYLSTHIFARRLGYEVIVLDFIYPQNSNSYNDLEKVIQYINDGDIAKAKQEINYIADFLIGNSKSAERIWDDGAKSVLACCIMAVVYDNRRVIDKSNGKVILKGHPEYQNLNNVFHFFSRMCRPDGEDIPLIQYLDEKGEDHPAYSMAGINNIAPFRTRASFYAQSITALRIYEDMNIASITSSTDFTLNTLGHKKQIVYIILPEEREEYYLKASMMIQQFTNILIANARESGGSLPIRTYFELDEAGNLPEIKNIHKNVTLLAGRGITYNFYIQSISQFENIYGREKTKIILDNIENWIYLKSNADETLNAISKKLNTYTTKVSTASKTSGKDKTTTTGFSYIERPLLKPDDIKKIQRPYQLVMGAYNPMLLSSHNLHEVIFNPMLGLGNEEHNKRVNQTRQKERKQHIIGDPPIWNIASFYSSHYINTKQKGEGVVQSEFESKDNRPEWEQEENKQ